MNQYAYDGVQNVEGLPNDAEYPVVGLDGPEAMYAHYCNEIKPGHDDIIRIVASSSDNYFTITTWHDGVASDKDVIICPFCKINLIQARNELFSIGKHNTK